jgi:GDP-4-dehydro-6-deoxy-D-mannose reductase
MPTILITGIGGFVGSHLADSLVQDRTINVVGIIHPTHPVQHLEERSQITIYREDILKPASLKRLLRKISPEEIYHLAGLAHVHESWKYRKETIQANFMGTFHLLEACRKLSSFPKVLLVGSAESYGIVAEDKQPISESFPLSPSSPYAVSKIAQETLGQLYAQSEKLPVYLCRSFNHTGPRQKETFVCSAFAKQIAMAENEQAPAVIEVGNLTARRDFSDVRDVVQAYQSILKYGLRGEPYNVSSGSAVSIEGILQTLLSFSKRQFEIRVDRNKFRPVDMPLLLGTYEKLQHQTGWEPRFQIRTTLSDLLDYWRQRIKIQAPVI